MYVCTVAIVYVHVATITLYQLTQVFPLISTPPLM